MKYHFRRAGRTALVTFGSLTLAASTAFADRRVIDLGRELNSPNRIGTDGTVVGNQHQYNRATGVKRLYPAPGGLTSATNLYDYSTAGTGIAVGESSIQVNGPGSPCPFSISPIPADLPLAGVYGANDLGEYAGRCLGQCTAFGREVKPCALLSAQTITFELNSEYKSGFAREINAGGEVTGTFFSSSGLSRAFYAARLQPLVDLGAVLNDNWTQAYDLNDAGKIVGTFDYSLGSGGRASHFRYFLLDANDFSIPPVDLGDAGDRPNIAINNGGEIVANRTVTDNRPPLNYTDSPSYFNPATGWEIFPGSSDYSRRYFPKYANDIGDNGNIVGQMLVEGDAAPHGFLIFKNDPVIPDFSFDSSPRENYVVWRPGNGTWYIDGENSDIIRQWGLPGDVPLRANHDLNSDQDFLVWRPSNGNWYGYGQAPEQFGLNGDYPVPAQFENQARSNIAVYRPYYTFRIDRNHLGVIEGRWYIKHFDGSVESEQWGLRNDLPVPEDYDGDGRSDIAVFRPATGEWFILKSSNGFSRAPGDFLRIQWGLNGDHPLPADYDGDGRTDLMVWRPSNGTWYMCSSIQAYDCTRSDAQKIFQFGLRGDIPVKRDLSGDGLADLVVWRPSTGTFFYRTIFWAANTAAKQWGRNGDIPVGAGIKSLINRAYGK